MSDLKLVDYDHDSEDCGRTASVPDITLNIEPPGRSHGGGSSNLAGSAPVNRRTDDVEASAKIALMPSSARRAPASSSEGCTMFRSSQSAEREQPEKEQQQMQQDQASMTASDLHRHPQMMADAYTPR